MKKNAIIIIAFNNTKLIEKQLELIDKFCMDEHDVIIFDNSSLIQIELPWKENHLYHKFEFGDYNNPSDSHSLALNAAYQMYADNYDKILFLDHDNFPIKSFSINEILHEKFINGLGQGNEKKYWWPGCLAFNSIFIEKKLVDFSTNQEFGLDTGGNLYKLQRTDIGIFSGYMNEKQYPNPYYTKEPYNFYTTINDDMFLHFTNASNWNKQEENEERIATLYRILDEKTS